ncbi:MAG TPA: hypothetical protein VNE63_19295 [Candidatus Acidoferrales bacterium]|nr:hypothetical protein [Candidatus Acidoferrales bacterium]
MRSWEMVSVMALAATLGMSPMAGAQSEKQAAATPAAAQAPSAVPNISGVWNAMRGNYDTASFSKGDPPMTAWGLEQYKAAKPSQGPRGVPLKDTNDMVYQCYSPGLPYIYLQLFPMEIAQTPTEVIELFEYDHSVRHIYLNRTKHLDDLAPTYMGDSIGHWEGNTLVVDTIGLNDKRWLDRVGHPASDQMHIIERIHRTDANQLQVDFTFDDPKAYTKTWTATMRFRPHPNWYIMEDMCMDNKGFESFEK